MSVNVPEATFNKLLYEIKNFQRFASRRISESYAYHLGKLVEELEGYQSLESNVRDDR